MEVQPSRERDSMVQRSSGVETSPERRQDKPTMAMGSSDDMVTIVTRLANSKKIVRMGYSGLGRLIAMFNVVESAHDQFNSTLDECSLSKAAKLLGHDRKVAFGADEHYPLSAMRVDHRPRGHFPYSQHLPLCCRRRTWTRIFASPSVRVCTGKHSRLVPVPVMCRLSWSKQD